jgi:5-oxoprolinase (ATP-hydrolysing)
MDSWQFFIDVGGTFTDCIATAPDGSVRTHKLLSSSTYKGRIAGVSGNLLESPECAGFPAHFFRGFSLIVFDREAQRPEFQGQVLASRPDGTLTIEQNSSRSNGVLEDLLGPAQAAGWICELRCPDPAPLCGIRYLMGLSPDVDIGPVVIKLGTTRGTNALLERTGARTALITTFGFRDVLAIAYQNRPRLFALNIRKHLPLYESVTEISERLDARGRVLIPLNEEELTGKLSALRDDGIQSLAICLLHAHRNPVHERRVAAIARSIGFGHVSLSSEVANLQKIVTRCDTTVVDAYLTPVIRDYIARIRSAAPAAQIRMITSAGGLVDAGQFIGKDSILSGPAGGVVGVAHVAKLTGRKKVIGFDMGGTSTDICRFDGKAEMRYEMEVNDPRTDAGSRIVAPMLAIETVAAGGGSVCAFDGARLTVGPASAGADPGPACYGNGGPLTITDCNLFLGRLPPESFSFPLQPKAAQERLQEIRTSMTATRGYDLSLEEIALGFLRVAASNMAQPVLKLSMHKGYDVRDYSLVSFGGAGAQHACQVASELGITSIIQHPLASVLSAFGISAADATRQEACDYGKLLPDVLGSELGEKFAELEANLTSGFAADPDLAGRPIRFNRSMDLRYKGQDSLINVATDRHRTPQELFEERHKQIYGFVFAERPIEIRNLRVEGVVKLATDPVPVLRADRQRAAAPEYSVQTWFDSGRLTTGIYQRRKLAPGSIVSGPALITDDMTTSVLNPGWQAEMLPDGILEFRSEITASHQQLSAGLDPVSLALFSNMFTSAAEQMGAVLQRTALSVNVKERLDFSCAVFASDGALIVNAPHIPVHLGSMGDSVRSVIRHAGDSLQAGDVFVTNDPYAGGSHLPDVTVITPVFSPEGHLLFFTGNRAHHAEIGGKTPGSMPPDSGNLAEEGVLIRNFRLVHAGVSCEDTLRTLLASGPCPSRNVGDNIADINAQIAANEVGRQLLLQLIDRYGSETVLAYMHHIRNAASDLMAAAVSNLPDKVCDFHDQLDDGSVIRLQIRRSLAPGKLLTFDFTGSSGVSSGNVNANTAIVKAAVLYCLRCLIDKDVPLNEGVLDPVEMIIPAPSLLDPTGKGQPDRPETLPAVTAGNVETSQRIVDVVLGALQLAAASQGTMNNLLFGRQGERGTGFGYYETVCGGAGAGPGFDGASAVHTHMTNTRITDPEVLEERFPVRLRRFEVRRGSGGDGAWTGGDGVVREIEFLEPLDLSLISHRRTTAPFGLAGGSPGAAGANRIKRHGSSTFNDMPGSFQTKVEPGDILLMMTPGGGGYGEP